MLKTVGFPSTRTGDQTIINGNLVIGTAGKGIDFSADPSAPGMTSELLDDYEEGTWTPTYEASGAAFTSITMDIAFAQYTKIGRQVTIIAQMKTDAINITGATGIVLIKGLPFAAGVPSAMAIGYASEFLTDTPRGGIVVSSQINLMVTGSSTSAFFGFTVANMQNGADKNEIILSATYYV